MGFTLTSRASRVLGSSSAGRRGGGACSSSASVAAAEAKAEAAREEAARLSAALHDAGREVSRLSSALAAEEEARRSSDAAAAAAKEAAAAAQQVAEAAARKHTEQLAEAATAREAAKAEAEASAAELDAARAALAASEERASRLEAMLGASHAARRGSAAHNPPGTSDTNADVLAQGATDVLTQGATVWYTSAGGAKLVATILKVHYDDVPPYYTISIDGNERSTVRTKLSPMPNATGAPAGPSAMAAEGPSTDQSPSQRRTFTPSYEWTAIDDDALVPAGLQIDLPLDGSSKRGRIPPTWALRVWLGDELGYWRTDVRRDTTFGELRAAVARFAAVAPSGVQWRLAGAGARHDGMHETRLVADGETVESAGLFERTRELVAVFSAAAAAAHSASLTSDHAYSQNFPRMGRLGLGSSRGAKVRRMSASAAAMVTGALVRAARRSSEAPNARRRHSSAYVAAKASRPNANAATATLDGGGGGGGSGHGGGGDGDGGGGPQRTPRLSSPEHSIDSTTRSSSDSQVGHHGEDDEDEIVPVSISNLLSA